MPIEHADGAEFDPDRDRPPVPEHLSDLRRGRRRRQIPVEVRVAEQGVPDRSAHAPRLESGALEGVGDLENGGRGLKLHRLGGMEADVGRRRWRIAASGSCVKMAPDCNLGRRRDDI